MKKSANYDLKTIINKVELQKDRRILVISDIHGGYDLFKTLLEKVNYTTNDYLFILGDLIEKGPNSLKTLRYIIELYKKGNVYVIMGNNDLTCLDILTDSYVDYYKDYFKRTRSIYHDYANELGIDIDKIDMLEFNEQIRSKYSEELAFVKNLPMIIETENLLFAHASITDYNNMDKLNPYEVMRYDYFMRKDFSFPKMLIVGHYPSVAFANGKCFLGPVTDKKKNITSIDGGFTAKIGGQINLLIYKNKDDLDYDFISLDDLPKAKVINIVKGKKATRLCIWDREKFKVLIHGKKRSLCLVERKFTLMDNAFVYPNKGKYYCADYTNEILPLTKGEMIGIVKNFGSKMLIKKDNVLGFTKTKNILGD